LADNDITDTFYWCINPDSGDTGGLLAGDWKTPEAAKLKLINVACPAPSTFLGGKPFTPSGAQDSPIKPPIIPDQHDPTTPQKPEAFAPASITTAASIAHSWKEGGVEHHQYDVVLKNTNTFAVGSRLQVKVGGAQVVKVWNVDDLGGGAYKLPAWLIKSGGLKAGASVTFGCITSSKSTAFQITCTK
jgi:hypothetical protein